MQSHDASSSPSTLAAHLIEADERDETHQTSKDSRCQSKSSALRFINLPTPLLEREHDFAGHVLKHAARRYGVERASELVR